MSHTRQTLHGSPEKSTACPFPEILDIGDPRPKKAEKDHLFGPCGAKLWGSGGAPPTNLILLRNQQRASRALVRRVPVPALERTRRSTHDPRQLRPPSHPPQRRFSFRWSGGWRVASISEWKNCVQRGTSLPPSTQATTAALRFAPDTFAKESVVPAIATTLLSNPLRSFRYRSSAPPFGPSVARARRVGIPATYCRSIRLHDDNSRWYTHTGIKTPR